MFEKGKKRYKIKKIYDARAEYILKKLEDDEFIRCDQVNSLVEETVNEIWNSNPWLKRPSLVVLDREITFNAYNFGEGTIGVHFGVFRRLSNTSELAFMLAHEMAHYHLDHVNSLVRHHVRRRKEGNHDELFSAAKYGDIDAVSSLFYENYSYSRENELAADSLAFIIINQSPFDVSACRGVLEKIDSADESEFISHPSIRDHLSFKKYPFKDHWLGSRQSVLSNTEAPNFIFNKDSIRTHPLAQERLEAYQTFLNENPTSTKDLISLNDLKSFVDEEIIDVAKSAKRYEYAFYYALKLRELYPKNELFTLSLFEILMDLYTARQDHNFGIYVSHVSENDWLKVYVNFLNNLNLSEIGALAYHFFQSNIDFNEEDENHYMLLWKASNYAEKPEVAENIKDAYLKKFPSGKYLNTFQSTLTLKK